MPSSVDGRKISSLVAVSSSVAQGEEIKYTHIGSLYPYIFKRERYRIAHPRIYIGGEFVEMTGGRNDDLLRVKWMVKCQVLPPPNLLLRVLPVKMHERLIFRLSRRCYMQLLQDDCNHESEIYVIW